MSPLPVSVLMPHRSLIFVLWLRGVCLAAKFPYSVTWRGRGSARELAREGWPVVDQGVAAVRPALVAKCSPPPDFAVGDDTGFGVYSLHPLVSAAWTTAAGKRLPTSP